VKFFLCLTKHHDMKMYGGVEIQFHACLFSVLYGGEWSDSRPGRFIPREKTRGTY